jgi:probable HAF family extracellular repeat protein
MVQGRQRVSPRKLFTLLVAACCLVVSGASSAAAPTYAATRLGTLGGNGSSGNAINAAGDVTGFSYVTHWTPPNPDPHTMWHAFVYSGGSMRDLGTLGGARSSGTGINASGQVAGFASLNELPYPQAAQHAFLYSDGVLRDLGTLSGSTSAATGINASGQVVGSSESATDPYGRAFLWSNGVMTDLGTLGGSGSGATGINAAGQVTGSAGATSVAQCGTPNVHAFRYSHGAMRDLGTLGGCGSAGIAINDAGDVIGTSSASGYDAMHAFVWSGGAMHDLGTLGGYSYPFAINGKGQVVGTSIAADGQNHAFLYTDGRMYDLNLLVTGLAGTLLSNATGINDDGQIVANGCSGSLICQAFRLDPVVAPVSPTRAQAVEYYHAAFDHYFVTADANEIAALDAGRFEGWRRTGETFNVYSGVSVGSASVCRFFSASFAPRSSHFYSPDAGECSIVKQSGDWLLEGDVMSAAVPDPSGNCPAGTQPLYRLYNNGQGAAPNHRYTTSLATRAQMMGDGWIPEGYGPVGVIMCAPL